MSGHSSDAGLVIQSMQRKRVFIALAFLSLVLACAVVAAVVYGYLHGSLAVRLTVAALGLCAAFGTLYLFAGLAGLIMGSWGNHVSGWLIPPMITAVRLLFPVVLWIAALLRISQARVRSSFIHVNNRLAYQAARAKGPKRVLVLLPHCIQSSACKFNVGNDILNCRQCGGCVVGRLRKLASDGGVVVSIVPGGTLARKKVAESRPDAVVAVACERDLSEGIVDCLPLPVIGVLNDRPNGPCTDTTVDVDRVVEAVDALLHDGIWES